MILLNLIKPKLFFLYMSCLYDFFEKYINYKKGKLEETKPLYYYSQKLNQDQQDKIQTIRRRSIYPTNKNWVLSLIDRKNNSNIYVYKRVDPKNIADFKVKPMKSMFGRQL